MLFFAAIFFGGDFGDQVDPEDNGGTFGEEARKTRETKVYKEWASDYKNQHSNGIWRFLKSLTMFIWFGHSSYTEWKTERAEKKVENQLKGIIDDYEDSSDDDFYPPHKLNVYKPRRPINMDEPREKWVVWSKKKNGYVPYSDREDWEYESFEDEGGTDD